MGYEVMCGGDGVLKAKSNRVLGERVVKGDELSLELFRDEDVPLVDGVLDGALGADAVVIGLLHEVLQLPRQST
ncbi:hypothetical protein Tco_1301033 [Tanacetum coccineum]